MRAPAGWLSITAALLAGAGAGACGGGQATPAHPDGGDAGARAQLSLAVASLTEGASGAGQDVVRLEVTIVNAGGAPVNQVATHGERITWSGLELVVSLAPQSAADTGPIAPGETRTLAFEGHVAWLGICSDELRATPGPHRGLVAFAANVASDGGGWSVQLDAAVTCTAPAVPPPPLTCLASLADGCAEKDMLGQPILRCLPAFGEALADTAFCGTGAIDVIAACAGGFTARTIGVGGVLRTYYYDGAGALVAVTEPNGASTRCLAGPTGTFAVPECGAPDAADRCPPSDGGTDAAAPDTDGGRRPPLDGAMPPPADGSTPPPPDGGPPPPLDDAGMMSPPDM